MRRSLSWRIILFSVALLGGFGKSEAVAQGITNCGSVVFQSANHTLTVTSSMPTISAYNPYNGSAGTQNFTITFTRNDNGVNNVCRVGLFILAGPSGKGLFNGTNTLSYDVKTPGGMSALYTAAPTGAVPIILSAARNGSDTVTVTLEVAGGQVKPALTYADNATVVMTTINNSNVPTAAAPDRTRALTPQATVIKSCQLSTPSASTLAFAASDIPNGLPNEGVIKSTSMSGSCNAPAILKLKGQALQPQIPTGPRPNFDNFINYTAAGTFNSASVTLNTTTTEQEISSSQTGAANSIVSGTVAVNVNLKRDKPVIAGSYTGVLTVTLDAAP